MDLSIGHLIASLIVSTVGFSLFLFGRKQKRMPHLLGGILLMACPYFLASVVGIYCLGSATAGGVWYATRSGL